MTSLMSNAKWRNVFAALARLDDITHMRVKFVDDNRVHNMAAPTLRALELNEAIFDSLEYGPVRYADIEWVELPAIVERQNPSLTAGRTPPTEIVQDIGRARAAIESLGEFALCSSAQGLRLLGYQR